MLAVVLLTGLAPVAVSAAAPEQTTVDVDFTVAEDLITVTGEVVFGEDLLGAKTVVTDPAGDAAVNGAGLDMTGLAIATDLAERTVTFTLSIADGAEEFGGNAPATGYAIPFRADDEDEDPTRLWLGAASAGTGTVPETGPWMGVCHNQGTGWNCSDRREGAVTTTDVTWVVPFDVPSGPTLQPGSVIRPGTVICGSRPCSFVWTGPIAFGPWASADRLEPWDAYAVPGEVSIGVGPAGMPEWRVIYTEAVAADGGTYSGTVPTPETPGEYALWVRTCGGPVSDLACVVEARDLTIPEAWDT